MGTDWDGEDVEASWRSIRGDDGDDDDAGTYLSLSLCLCLSVSEGWWQVGSTGKGRRVEPQGGCCARSRLQAADRLARRGISDGVSRGKLMVMEGA